MTEDMAMRARFEVIPFESRIGSIELVIGPMFSCKSSELRKRITRAIAIGKKAIVINHVSDIRYSSESFLATHSGDFYPAIPMEKLSEVLEQEHLPSVDLVVIDEGQFFPDLKEMVILLSSHPYNKRVIVGSLSGDSNMEPFGQVHELICKASEITHLTALCKLCKGEYVPAPFSKLINGTKDGQVKVGGKDSYIAVCRQHYYQ